MALCLLALLAAVEARGEWLTTSWRVIAEDPKDCIPTEGEPQMAETATAYQEAILEKASVWLGGLGFPNPRLDTRRDRDRHDTRRDRERPRGFYELRINDAEVRQYDASGLYFPAENRADARIFIRCRYAPPLALPFPLHPAPGEDSETKRYRTDHYFTGATSVHELFHAVQWGNHGRNPASWPVGDAYDEVRKQVEERDWIIEGTADAVASAFYELVEPRIPAPQAGRYYDDPLHEPPTSSEAYGTARFWRVVGSKLGSPYEIAYLKDVLATDLTEHKGLKGVDAALTPHGGLYELFPRALSSGHHEIGFRTRREWSVALPRGRDEARSELVERARAVAGRASRLEVDHAAGRPLELEVRLAGDHPDLHLIVGGHLYNVPYFLGRNVFRALVPPGKGRCSREGGATPPSPEHCFDIVVVNVAPKAIESVERSFTLVATLRDPPPCSLFVTLAGDTEKGPVHRGQAHFSTEGRATIMGAFTNPTVLEDVMGIFGDDGGEAAEAWRREMAQQPRETLGISLVEMGTGGGEAELLAMMGGGFKLMASVMDREIEPGFTGDLPLGHLMVHTGEYAGGGYPMKYEWSQGAPGGATLEVRRFTGGSLEGTIRATMLAPGLYEVSTGRPPEISLTATFHALEFAPTRFRWGCMGEDL